MKPISGKRLVLLLVGLAIGVAPLAAALAVDSYELRRNEAYKLTDAHSADAEKALQVLLKERPNDGGVLFALGRVAMHNASPLEPGAERREMNRKVLDYFARARSAGFTDPLIDHAFKEINPDGSENKSALSNRVTVDRLLQEGEKYFGQHEFAKAGEKYAEAFREEPTSYVAAVYAGDAHFAANQFPEALGWFAKAIDLNPDKEIAFRYAGDALMRLGRRSEAMDRYLAAAIAEPYAGYPWRALNTYCTSAMIKAWTTPRNIPTAGINEANGKAELGLPKDFTPFDIVYGTARLSWQNENRAKRFPAGTKYRLTLEEESFALLLTLKTYREIKQAPNPPADLVAGLQKIGMFLDHLGEIEEAGMLEAHILLVRGDADLAQDYPTYRASHRQQLHDYLSRFYLHVQ